MSSTPPGWYPNQHNQMQYWDGQQWLQTGPPQVFIQTKRSNGYAITGLILGLVAMLFTITLLGIILAIPIGIIGLIFSLIAYSKRRESGGAAMAVWGIILNGIPTLIAAVSVIGSAMSR